MLELKLQEGVEQKKYFRDSDNVISICYFIVYLLLLYLVNTYYPNSKYLL